MFRVVKYRPMNISVVIPVYRGAHLITRLVERCAQALPVLAEEFEVILVNDGSPDDAWTVIEQLASRYPWVVGLNLMRNYGQHNATLCGVRAARHEVCVTLDQDLQHPPEEIPILLAELEKGFDVVYGAPRKLPQGFLRNFMTSAIKSILAHAMSVPSVRTISAFRAFRTELRQAFALFQNPNLIIDVLLSWGTGRITSVPVNILAAESSNYSLGALVKAAVLILTGYSTAPLRLGSWLGFGMTFFGLAVFLYVCYVYFAVGSVPGFPFLASIISLFGGAQLLMLGIFGEYLARIFDRSMDRPTYVVSSRTGQP